jgi:hypothetical protein
MKKLLIGSLVAVLCTGAPAVYAEDTHGGAPETKSAPGDKVLPKQPAAPDESMKSAGDSCVADAQMGKAQERMKQAQAIMAKLRKTKDPAKRRKLMQEHTQAMRDTLGMMHDMKMGKMGCGQGMGMMGGDHKMGAMGGDQGMGMMGMHQMMEERMGMMQMMMEQMFERQEMLMKDGK